MPASRRLMRSYFERRAQRSARDHARSCTEARDPAGDRLKWAVSYCLVTRFDYSVTRRLNFKPDGD